MKKFFKYFFIIILILGLVIGGMVLVYTQKDKIDDYLGKNEVKDGYVLTRVGLSPLGIVEEKNVDLEQNPVRIIFTNTKDDKTIYQFTFDKNSDLKIQKSMSMEIGEYSYTILSKQLLFEDVSGVITIDETSHILTFDYSLKLNQSLTFSIAITDYSGTVNRLHLHSDPENVELIRNELPTNKTYLVTCYIFDEDGAKKEEFVHTHSVTGTCSDTWTFSKLTTGREYTMQLRFTSQEDANKTFLSDIATFKYENTKAFQVAYDVVKN